MEFLLFEAASLAIVPLVAVALRRSKKTTSWSFARLYATAAAGLGVLVMLTAPLTSLPTANGPVDLCASFLVFPGVHIFLPMHFGSAFWYEPLAELIGGASARVVLLVLWEGLVGSCLGVLQWLFFGWFFDRIRHSWTPARAP